VVPFLPNDPNNSFVVSDSFPGALVFLSAEPAKILPGQMGTLNSLKVPIAHPSSMPRVSGSSRTEMIISKYAESANVAIAAPSETRALR
jgi:hypothetical protein